MNDEWVPREQYEALLGMAARQSAPPPPATRKPGGFVRFVGELFQMVLVAGAIVGAYFLLQIFVGAPAAMTPPPPAQGAPYPTAPYQTTYSRPQPVTTGGGGLPPCSSVTDTRTACEPDQSAPAVQVEQLPTEAPAPTATPPWLANCWTEPGERPCWLPPDAPWEAPAEVPATPVVLVDDGWHAPMVVPADVCAQWHPPQAMPEGCGDE